jgi:CHAD domain-containing protein
MREREAKFVVAAAFDLPDLSTAIPRASLGEPTDAEVDDVYYDTPDLRLARWGCTIRHRRGSGWTVKLPHPSSGPVLDRSEVQFDGGPDEPPAAALALVDSLTRRAAVEEVARVRTHRRTRTWVDPAGRPVAAITDDDVHGTSSDGAEVRFREIEVELDEQADAALLAGVVTRLEAVVPERVRPVPKAARVLGDRATQPPDVVTTRLPTAPTARDVIRAALASSVAQLLLQLPAARLGGDPEGVHQARVAARRMNSDLKTFAPLLEEVWVAHLRVELRWLIDALGAVRDCDILSMKLRDVADDHPEIDRHAAEMVLEHVEDRRRSSRCDLLHCLDDDRAARLLDDLVEAATAPAVRRRAERRARDVLPALVRKHWRRIDREISALGRHPHPAKLHAVRISAKRLRYATEAVAPAVGKPARQFAKRAARIQDALGELNDAAVARDWLRSAAEHLTGPAAFAAGQMAQLLVAEATTHDRTWRTSHRSMRRRTDWFE